MIWPGDKRAGAANGHKTGGDGAGRKTIFLVCSTDSAHTGGSALTSSAAVGVRGLVSPGHQSNSAALHNALHDAELHHAQMCVNLHTCPCFSFGQFRPRTTLDRHTVGNLACQALIFCLWASVYGTSVVAARLVAVPAIALLPVAAFGGLGVAGVRNPVGVAGAHASLHCTTSEWQFLAAGFHHSVA